MNKQETKLTAFETKNLSRVSKYNNFQFSPPREATREHLLFSYLLVSHIFLIIQFSFFVENSCLSVVCMMIKSLARAWVSFVMVEVYEMRRF